MAFIVGSCTFNAWGDVSLVNGDGLGESKSSYVHEWKGILMRVWNHRHLMFNFVWGIERRLGGRKIVYSLDEELE